MLGDWLTLNLKPFNSPQVLIAWTAQTHRQFDVEAQLPLQHLVVPPNKYGMVTSYLHSTITCPSVERLCRGVFCSGEWKNMPERWNEDLGLFGLEDIFEDFHGFFLGKEECKEMDNSETCSQLIKATNFEGQIILKRALFGEVLHFFTPLVECPIKNS